MRWERKGGFFLTTGCERPVDAKFENVKMMIEVAKDRISIKEQ
jgi:uroporphyrinogen-III decarboxylase